MSIPLVVHLVVGLGVFVVGTVVGSFLNVCIYRIPWQKSVVWPGSHCPRCLLPIAAHDNVPVLGWLVVRGECRRCGLPISARYPLIELMVGLLFLGAYVLDVASVGVGRWGDVDPARLVAMTYHLILIALLVVATFIDFDLFIIPDAVTVPGMVLGVALGAVAPWARPEPAHAETFLGGLGVGVLGLLAGGGLVWGVRILAGLAFGREAMGFGDVTLMAMIGSFMGWQAAVLTFFLAPFFGLGQAAVKLFVKYGKRLAGRPLSSLDHELPFGPYLSMAALTLLFGWRPIWDGWAASLFETISVLSWFLLGLEN